MKTKNKTKLLKKKSKTKKYTLRNKYKKTYKKNKKFNLLQNRKATRKRLTSSKNKKGGGKKKGNKRKNTRRSNRPREGPSGGAAAPRAQLEDSVKLDKMVETQTAEFKKTVKEVEKTHNTLKKISKKKDIDKYIDKFCEEYAEKFLAHIKAKEALDQLEAAVKAVKKVEQPLTRERVNELEKIVIAAKKKANEIAKAKSDDDVKKAIARTGASFEKIKKNKINVDTISKEHGDQGDAYKKANVELEKSVAVYTHNAANERLTATIGEKLKSLVEKEEKEAALAIKKEAALAAADAAAQAAAQELLAGEAGEKAKAEAKSAARARKKAEAKEKKDAIEKNRFKTFPVGGYGIKIAGDFKYLLTGDIDLLAVPHTEGSDNYILYWLEKQYLVHYINSLIEEKNLRNYSVLFTGRCQDFERFEHNEEISDAAAAGTGGASAALVSDESGSDSDAYETASETPSDLWGGVPFEDKEEASAAAAAPVAPVAPTATTAPVAPAAPTTAAASTDLAAAAAPAAPAAPAAAAASTDLATAAASTDLAAASTDLAAAAASTDLAAAGAIKAKAILFDLPFEHMESVFDEEIESTIPVKVSFRNTENNSFTPVFEISFSKPGDEAIKRITSTIRVPFPVPIGVPASASGAAAPVSASGAAAPVSASVSRGAAASAFPAENLLDVLKDRVTNNLATKKIGERNVTKDKILSWTMQLMEILIKTHDLQVKKSSLPVSPQQFYLERFRTTCELMKELGSKELESKEAKVFNKICLESLPEAVAVEGAGSAASKSPAIGVGSSGTAPPKLSDLEKQLLAFFERKIKENEEAQIRIDQIYPIVVEVQEYLGKDIRERRHLVSSNLGPQIEIVEKMFIENDHVLHSLFYTNFKYSQVKSPQEKIREKKLLFVFNQDSKRISPVQDKGEPISATAAAAAKPDSGEQKDLMRDLMRKLLMVMVLPLQSKRKSKDDLSFASGYIDSHNTEQKYKILSMLNHISIHYSLPLTVKIARDAIREAREIVDAKLESLYTVMINKILSGPNPDDLPYSRLFFSILAKELYKTCKRIREVLIDERGNRTIAFEEVLDALNGRYHTDLYFKNLIDTAYLIANRLPSDMKTTP